MSNSDSDLINFGDTEGIADLINQHDEEAERDKIYNTILLIQEYCIDHCLPIFNRNDALSIAMSYLT